MFYLLFFFFNDTATTEIYTLSLHDALPIWVLPLQNTTQQPAQGSLKSRAVRQRLFIASTTRAERGDSNRSEEHTSELQSRLHLVCRLLLEKKKNDKPLHPTPQRLFYHQRRT